MTRPKNALTDGSERRRPRMRRRGFRHDPQHHHSSLSGEGARQADDHSSAGLQESRIDGAAHKRRASPAAIVFRIAPRRLASLTDAHSAPARARFNGVALGFRQAARFACGRSSADASPPSPSPGIETANQGGSRTRRKLQRQITTILTASASLKTMFNTQPLHRCDGNRCSYGQPD